MGSSNSNVLVYFPTALHTASLYASLHFPPSGNPYNPVQQLSYFGVVFLLGPFMIATGAAMSPAIAGAIGIFSYRRTFSR
ncbi:MAG: hypothetical protein WAM14_07575 [Candidatus Nitrosopolaris sp.]